MMVNGLLRILQLAALSLPLSACAAAGYAIATATNATISVDDPRWVDACAQFSGIRHDFTPKSSSTVRIYDFGTPQSACDGLCAELFEQGWGAVERAFQSDGQVSSLPRLVLFSDGGETITIRSGPRDPISGRAPLPPLYEAVRITPAPRTQSYMTDEIDLQGRRTIAIDNVRPGRIEGEFIGVRRTRDGALLGEGRFTLRADPRHNGDMGAELAHCGVEP